MMRETMLNDVLLQLLTFAAKPKTKALLNLVCQAVLATVFDEKKVGERNSFQEGENRKDLAGAYDGLRCFVTMVSTLLMNDLCYDFASVQHFLNYQGACLFTRAVKAAITPGTPLSEALRPMERSSYQMWQELTKDILQTAASAELLRPEMLTLKSHLEEETAEIHYIVEAARKLAGFRSGLRKGETKDFEKQLLLKLTSFADEVLTTGQAISSDDLAALDHCMTMLGKDDKILACQGRLRKFATDHNKAICQQDLKAWATKLIKMYEGEGEGDPGQTQAHHHLNSEQVGILKDLLQKCGATIPDDIKPICCNVVKYGIKEAFGEAGPVHQPATQ